jgi:uncharacterized protein
MDTRINEIAEKYAELVKNTLPASMVILYGSYARGEERENSDIDIAVVFDELQNDYLETAAKLVSLCRKVDVVIEPKLIIKKDNQSGFLESILKYGKIIYNKDNPAN